MPRYATVLLVCAVLSITAGLAHAGPCSEEIAKVRQAARDSAGDPALGPTTQQSVGAQLGHQPTPESVGRAQAEAQSRFAAALERAEALDAEGKTAECTDAVGEARQLLELN